MDRLRIDKWLWSARFYKTRTLAAEEIGKGRVEVNGQEAKPAREVKVGDTVAMRREAVTRTVVVKGVSADARAGAGGAAAVRRDGREPEGARKRARSAAMAPEPALSIEHGRPTKRGRRDLDEASRQGWGDRWSASRLLVETGTAVVKCMLHIDKDEQRERLQARIDTPGKQWKFSMGDLEVRTKWPAYQRTYESALSATSTEHAPWYVIPANSKRHRNLMIAQLLMKTLRQMKFKAPPPDPALKGMIVK
jgi:ribosomal 50S subunit-recycling heat shock protein